MWFRRATRLAAAATLLPLALGGCSDMYFARRDTMSVVSGEAQATNRVTQMIDPWPAATATELLTSMVDTSGSILRLIRPRLSTVGVKARPTPYRL